MADPPNSSRSQTLFRHTPRSTQSVNSIITEDDVRAAQGPSDNESNTMTSLTFASSLLEAGNISKAQFDTLIVLISHNVSKAANKDSITISAVGNISISRTVTPRLVEAVAAVFNTAELLEAVLLFVPAADLIFDVTLVCKGFDRAVEASVKLKQATYRLSSRPWETRELEAFPVCIEGFTFEVYTSCTDPGFLDVHTATLTEHVKCSSKLRAYQLTRPAIMAVDLLVVTNYKYHQDHSEREYPANITLQKCEGIPFGDILDMVEREGDHEATLRFAIHTELLGEGRSSEACQKWMAGEDFEVWQ